MSEPFCIHQPACQGCPNSALPYPEQLERKRETLRAALQPYPELHELSQQGVAPCAGAEPTTGYRVRAKLVCEGTALGLFGAGHSVVDIPQCRILRPRVAAAVAAVRARLPLPFKLLALDVREADKGVLVTLIVPTQTAEGKVRDVANKLMQEHNGIIGVSMSERAVDSPQVLGSPPRPLLGKTSAPHRIEAAGPYHLAIPGGFVQSHLGQASRLHDAIESGLKGALGNLKDARVLELYAGSGALALRLAKSGAHVTAVDNYAPNIDRLTETAKAQELELVGLVERSEVVLQARDTSYDAVIVDPPRRGLTPEVRLGLAALGARCLVLVSCEPRTLARDLAHLRRIGYVAAELQPWDLLPHSDAVETFALLSLAEAVPPEVLYQDEHLVVVNKTPFLSTTPQGEYSTSLLDGVRKLPGCEQAVPVHRLDRDTSGVCLFARQPTSVEALSNALTHGQKTYLALAQGTLHKRGIIRRKLRDGTRWVEATTRYTLERRVGTHSLVRVHPENGRKHQIRRHLSGLGHPVLGDERYGKPATNRFFEERHGLDRTFLHCQQIVLELNGTQQTLTSPLSADLLAVIASLENS